MTRKTKHLYAIGHVVKVFGVRGEVVVKPFTGSTSRFNSLDRMFVGRDEAGARETSVEYVKPGKGGIRLKLSDIPDRTHAEQIVGAYVFVAEDQRIRLPRGAYFVEDIVGSQVLDQDGRTVGLLKAVLKMPAQDVYVVDDNGKEIMIPAVKEFIREIDLSTQTVRVNLIDGMVE